MYVEKIVINQHYIKYSYTTIGINVSYTLYISKINIKWFGTCYTSKVKILKFLYVIVTLTFDVVCVICVFIYIKYN